LNSITQGGSRWCSVRTPGRLRLRLERQRDRRTVFYGDLLVALLPTVSLGRHVEVEYGSLYPIPGKSTATVGYDNDGYLAGHRVRLTKSTWLFDEITGTYAHFGATDRQQFTGRLAILFHPNLAQVFATKQITPRLTVAGDYMSGTGTHAFRLALTAENRVGWTPRGLRCIERWRDLAASVLACTPDDL
jgi:hypothetical protein